MQVAKYWRKKRLRYRLLREAVAQEPNGAARELKPEAGDATPNGRKPVMAALPK